ncbi:MAG TPA: RICIN domain-containing protein [Chitinophagaceae bacterium]|nr:RICIN domain-containing protein [Chitinophagaceae bacterium]
MKGKALYLLIFLLPFIFSCRKEGANKSPDGPDTTTTPVISDTVATQYATWIMVWDRASENWWNPNEHNGATVYVEGKWQSINWMDHAQVDEYIAKIKASGINILICDLTNGWSWLDDEVQYIQSLCVKNGMKLCVAENSQGDLATFESHAGDIWDKFAGPSSPYASDSTYLLKDGKPVIVCYGIRSWYKGYKNSNGEYRQKFNLVWASGEDSDKDKWGWQLEPWIGSVPSSDVMFVTPAIKWGNDANLWRSSLSWLDYNFLLARKNDPRYVIVGSYDDLDERNGWLTANTENCVPGLQMRDKDGSLRSDAYYKRVKEWVSGKPDFVAGGLIPDGCYRIINKKSNKFLTLKNTGGKIGSPLIQHFVSDTALNDYFWLYHLGNNSYRIVVLNNGLSLSVPNGSGDNGIQVTDSLPADIQWQNWTLKDLGDGYYSIKNDKSGKVLEVSGAAEDNGAFIVQGDSNNGSSQQWKFDKILNLEDID